MKSGSGLLLVCIVAVAGIATLLLSIDLVSPFRSANVVRQEAEPPPDASSHAKTKQASKRARSRAVIEPAPTQDVGTVDPAGTQNETTEKTYGRRRCPSRD